MKRRKRKKAGRKGRNQEGRNKTDLRVATLLIGNVGLHVFAFLMVYMYVCIINSKSLKKSRDKN